MAADLLKSFPSPEWVTVHNLVALCQMLWAGVKGGGQLAPVPRLFGIGDGVDILYYSQIALPNDVNV